MVRRRRIIIALLELAIVAAILIYALAPRSLAADVKISVITVKRAYEDLEKEGMIYSVQGKGFYVDNPDLQYVKEKETVGIEEHLSEWVGEAKKVGMTKQEALDMLDILWE